MQLTVRAKLNSLKYTPRRAREAHGAPERLPVTVPRRASQGPREKATKLSVRQKLQVLKYTPEERAKLTALAIAQEEIASRKGKAAIQRVVTG